MSLGDSEVFNSRKWENVVFRQSVYVKAWMLIAIASLFSTTVLLYSYTNLTSEVEKSIKNTRIVLTPAIKQEIVIEGNETVSQSFAKAFLRNIVEMLENWNHVNVEDNYKQLFEIYYDQKQTSTTKTNLMSSQYFEKIKELKMASYIDIDWSKSKIGYCQKIERICGLIVGKRNVFIEFSRPYSTREVSYFIMAKVVRPDPVVSPMALKVTRVSVYDSQDEENQSRAKKEYELALAGEIRE
ncbi:MAG: hypothetical protein COV57_03085 [Candidatus Liptonbacteria bacterium CG11_big_fil_rev_8_21_14_0_20_35_14]|uniref:Uncharacterized protein n=1 Tax=Candidatus Liptonbacteria bacterium CG11_big_fil_rev_8_21_14_0_20_35_14 TaxID=1974634 RepID=A0A2H0N6Z6_9BACT|nr:MAG: hypothetical protein COV57_03085 [Candidatus Liptonbacteria bacterium CG11_big_fil_rev_8_21_14_0_20_35_14]PJB52562.1 MAG: hypothetical protein CO099_11910 [Bdellovibrio sp. CG_4_9_14_3_um_filter_39_7]